MDAAIPWRRTAILASTVAAAELLVLLVIGVIVLARPFAHSLTHNSRATARTLPAPTRQVESHHIVRAPIVPRVTRSHTRVLVLNGNGQSGAAGSEAATLRLHGYRISATGNAKRMDYATSLVMYRPGYAFAARRLAHDVGIRLVGPLDGLRTRDLRGSQLVVVVGG
jgi:hypothetical protein